ncbi:hypothetical protein AXF42_Ash009357 [Apostasia shenzhenica]|uniref:Uncharacterized protein n=1 Tax=Apostasia shenzhenica TaxID=1088818 RepID=A0A2I0B3V0_9ASPA|nr:hypothetical protein AXF42_Ash009357 [Apostasia shenzhenica]
MPPRFVTSGDGDDDARPGTAPAKLFGRRRPLYQLFGGGKGNRLSLDNFSGGKLLQLSEPAVISAFRYYQLFMSVMRQKWTIWPTREGKT